MATEKRFEVKLKERDLLNASYLVIVDKQTGVNYLLANTGYGAGLTPLLNENGNVVVTK